MEHNKYYWQSAAERYDITFNGMQKFPRGKELPMFTHTVYGTFVLNENETLPQAILRKQKQFNELSHPERAERVEG